MVIWIRNNGWNGNDMTEDRKTLLGLEIVVAVAGIVIAAALVMNALIE
jgi:hypothetical protein